MSINKRDLEVLLKDWPGDGSYDQIGADFATVLGEMYDRVIGRVAAGPRTGPPLPHHPEAMIHFVQWTMNLPGVRSMGVPRPSHPG